MLFSSVVIPLFLLATFRFTGVLQGPVVISETVTAEARNWEIERIDASVDIEESTENSYASRDVFMSFSVLVDRFEYEWGYPMFTIFANGTAHVPQGYVVGISVKFRNDFQNSRVFIETENGVPEYGFAVFNNLSFSRYDSTGYIYGNHSGELVGNIKAFIEARSIDQPKDISFRIIPRWWLDHQTSQTDRLELQWELTYFNGTFVKSAIVPIILNVVPDAGNGFETARTVSFGNYTAFIDYAKDTEDYYQAWFNASETIRIRLSMVKLRGLYLNLTLYNPNKEIAAISWSGIPNNIEEITYSITQDGNWYIQVVNARRSAETLYVLSIEKVEPRS